MHEKGFESWTAAAAAAAAGFPPRRVSVPVLFRDGGSGHPNFPGGHGLAKQEALLAAQAAHLAGLAAAGGPPFPFPPLPFPPPGFGLPPSSSASSLLAANPSLLSAFSQNLKPSKLW